MKVDAYFRKAFGLGFDWYGEGGGHLYLDIYLGPLTIECFGRSGESGRDPERRDPASGECQHSWSDWGGLENMEMPAPSYGLYVGDAPRANIDAVVQTRRCLKCNLHQRARIS